MTSRICAYEFCNKEITGHFTKKYCCHKHKIKQSCLNKKKKRNEPQMFVRRAIDYSVNSSTLMNLSPEKLARSVNKITKGQLACTK